jgi:cytochrome c-type biogenesis protein CcmH/NrfG
MSSPIPPGSTSDPVVNDAWYLHRQGRRFGPLTEDEMRGHFRAGMVHADDAIGVAGQVGTVPASDVAASLGLPPLVAASRVATPTATILVDHSGGQSSSKLVVACGAVVALVGALYFSLHTPAGQPASMPAPSPMPASPVRVEAPASVDGQAGLQAPSDIATAPMTPPRDLAVVPAPVDVAPDAHANVAPAKTFVIATTAATQPAADTWWTEALRLKAAADWPALAEHAQKWTVAQPRVAASWWFLGHAKMRLGEFDAAIDAFQRGLAVAPGEYNTRFALADVYFQAHRDSDGLAVLEPMLREFPGNAELWHYYGIALSQLGQVDQSIAALQKSLQLEPGNRQAWADLAQNYAHFGNMDKANEALAHANAH